MFKLIHLPVFDILNYHDKCNQEILRKKKSRKRPFVMEIFSLFFVNLLEGLEKVSYFRATEL
jgi:hypothetical protein